LDGARVALPASEPVLKQSNTIMEPLTGLHPASSIFQKPIANFVDCFVSYILIRHEIQLVYGFGRWYVSGLGPGLPSIGATGGIY
jgi:hypothetical protein